MAWRWSWRIRSLKSEAYRDVRLWRAVDVYRGVTLGYAVALFVPVRQQYRHPVGAAAVLAVMAAWTGYLLLRRVRLHRPVTARVLTADLLVTAGCVLATLVVDDPARIADGAATLPAIWAASPVVGAAVGAGWAAGLAGALVIGAADVVEVWPNVHPSTIDSIVQLLLVGTVVGYTAGLYSRGRRDLARAVAIEAVARDRERLAADIHDSVLQVLSYVQRRGIDAGGEAAEIGRLAGEQEVRLRAMVASGAGHELPHGTADVKALLAGIEGTGVTVTGPTSAVLLPADAAQALAAAVREALDNVARHAGPQARAWVLVEDEPDVVTVTVRDDGPGIEPGRLDAARREGRLGFAASIKGRMEAFDGQVDVVSAPGQGTEIELRLPRIVVAGR